MKTFVNQAAQGDLLVRRVQDIPKSAKKVAPEKGVHIVSHSETGHHHVIADAPNVIVYETDDPLVSYLEVVQAADATETLLKHLRSYDTHETIKIPVGKFELRRQRENAPEGWRRVQD